METQNLPPEPKRRGRPPKANNVVNLTEPGTPPKFGPVPDEADPADLGYPTLDLQPISRAKFAAGVMIGTVTVSHIAPATSDEWKKFQVTLWKAADGLLIRYSMPPGADGKRKPLERMVPWSHVAFYDLAEVGK